MIPSQVAKKKLTYNQLRQTIQKLLIQENKEVQDVVTSEDVENFISRYLIESLKK